MALSNISQHHLESLLSSLSQNDNSIEIIKSNYSQYGKLKQIAKQMYSLRNEALELIEDSKIQNNLNNIKKKFKLVSGNTYYLYEDKDKHKFFSLISPNEWKQNNNLFLDTYYYDYDKQFIKKISNAI